MSENEEEEVFLYRLFKVMLNIENKTPQCLSLVLLKIRQKTRYVLQSLEFITIPPLLANLGKVSNCLIEVKGRLPLPLC